MCLPSFPLYTITLYHTVGAGLVPALVPPLYTITLYHTVGAGLVPALVSPLYTITLNHTVGAGLVPALVPRSRPSLRSPLLAKTPVPNQAEMNPILTRQLTNRHTAFKRLPDNLQRVGHHLPGDVLQYTSQLVIQLSANLRTLYH